MTGGPQNHQRVAEQLEIGMESGLHLGGQIYVSHRDTVWLDDCFGEARIGEPMTDEHLPIWFSAGKPVVAISIAQLWERGNLKLDDTVAEFIPEFAGGDKAAVTIRHLLTHTGGFRMLDLGWPTASWDEIIDRICSKRLEPGWVPGVTAGYDRMASWFILGEIVRRVDGRRIEDYVREEVFAPLGMQDSWIGMSAAQYRRYGNRIAPLFDTTSSEPRRTRWDSEPWVTSCAPGANARGPVRDLGRLYRTLLGGGILDRARILSPQTIEAITAGHRIGQFDKTFQAVLDWGLGFVKNSASRGAESGPYGFGRHASYQVFGHSGYRSSIAFADPAHKLVVALVVNGTPTEPEHRRYVQGVVDAIYKDLGLVAE